MIRPANGRYCRAYFYDAGHDPFCVTYHRAVRGQMRLLTVSLKLMRKVLR